MTIKRRDFLKGALAAGAGFSANSLDTLLWTRVRTRPGFPSTPNLVFVFPDQLRAQALGFMDEEPARTPFLDRFARQGIVFTQAVSNYPLCSPYRAMLWSGKYPLADGVTENLTSQAGERGLDFKPDVICLSDILKKRGYSLGYIGKWHLDPPRKPYVNTSNNRAEPAWNEWTPFARRHGFDFWYTYGTYDQHMRPMYWSTDAERDGFAYVDQWGPEYEAGLAARYIRNDGGAFRDPEKPFALVVSMNPPHMPYDQVPDRYLELYKDIALDDLCRRPNIPTAGMKWGDYYRKNIRGYYAMITGVDEQFGRILSALAEAGLEDNTIVVFTSDHGNCLGIHDEISKNNPYEESVRIPLIIRWPDRIQARRDEALISVPDMMPSLLDLMGFRTEIPAGAQGTNYGRLIRTGEGPRPSSQLYLKIPLGEAGQGLRGVRTERYTLVLEKRANSPARPVLFDNRKDPFQTRDIASDSPEIVRGLIEGELKPWLEKTSDPWLTA